VADAQVRDNTEQHRFEIVVEGAVAGFADYHDGPNGRAFTHTEVDSAYEGQGLGSKLISAVLDDARSQHRTVLPFCDFVQSYIKRHPDYLDLVHDPARFDLASSS
jgi:predicted GNAT family acetyltransferase